ncbi:MAG: T9SS type A sorting domain-containing protein [Bacteroidales bacterium]
MKTAIRTSIIIVLFQLYCFDSFSQIRTLCIKGAVVYVDDMQNVLSGSVAVGDSVNGKIKYDLSITDNNSLTQVGDYYNTLAPAGIQVNINSRIFQTDSNNVNFLLETVNNYNNNDNIVFRSYNNIFTPDVPALNFETHIAWQLNDTNQTALSSTNIPTFINLNSWQQPFALTIEGSNMDGDTNIFIRALVTNVDTCENLTSIENLFHEKNMVVVYPNPLNSSATIQFNSVINNAELNIYNLYGQKVITINHISGDRIKIYRDHLQSGVYFIHLTQDSKTIVTDKLIITD